MTDLESEKSALDLFKNHIKIALSEAAYISRWGDGNCGYILNFVTEELKSLGLYQEDNNTNIGTKKNKKSKINAQLRKLTFERDLYRCKHCGTHKDLTVDHVIPESKGGLTNINNTLTLCQSCNSKKGTK